MRRQGDNWPTHRGKARRKKQIRKMVVAALERESKENMVGI